MSLSVRLLMSARLDVWRNPPLDEDGIGGAAQPYALGVPCLPLSPASLEIVQRSGLTASMKLFETVIGASDVRDGDVAYQGGQKYSVKAVGVYDWPEFGSPDSFRVLVLERLVQT